MTTSQVNLDTFKLWHVTSGLYIWEFLSTLDYEWKVFRGRLPYRWTIWIYSFTRVAALVGVILCLVIVNVTTPINCQLLIVLSSLFFCFSAATASLLIILRTIAIWNRNKVVLALTITIYGVNIAFHLQGLIKLRSVRAPTQFACETVTNDPSLLSFIPAMISDVVLLLIVLAGLLVIRPSRSFGTTYGLTGLVWKQGVIWLILGSAAEIPPIVLALLHFNDPLHRMFETPGVIIMSIAATRMHRCLVVNFASSDEMHEGPKMSRKLAFAKAKYTDTPSTQTVPDRVEVAVQKACGHHPTHSVNDSESTVISTNTPPDTVSPFPSSPQAQDV